jgi:glycosyltransferase involved in cell wall biosynthesis
VKFSVLLPTRNRVDLLRYAVESVRRQDFADWEIVVSDNDSTDETQPYVRSLADSRIRYIRSPQFVPVTDNWNKALAASRGDYVVMLGDDDSLLPGYFSKLARLTEQFANPELAYVQAVQYAYPGVIPGNPNAFVQTGYCEFLEGRKEPFLLAPEQARSAVDKSMAMRLAFSYNMQHSLVSRRSIERLASHGPFFQSPYPDYYATNVLLLTSKSILVVPEPLVAIGISPKSFGHYYFNGREAEGTAFLNNMGESSIPDTVRAVLLPGNALITCWYAAMACIERNFGGEYGVHADTGRYRQAQVLYTDRGAGRAVLRELWSKLTLAERLRYGSKRLLLAIGRRVLPRAAKQLWHRLAIFPPFDTGKREVPYRTILELFESYGKIQR